MDLAYLVNLVTMSCALVISIMLLISLLSSREHKREQRWFFYTVLLNVLGVLCEVITAYLMGRPGVGIGLLLKFCDWTSYTLSALMNVTFTLYISGYLKAKGKNMNRFILPVFVCSGLSVLLAFISQVTGLYSYFDLNNNYQQGTLFWIALIPPMLSLFVLLTVVLRCLNDLNRREGIALLAYAIVPIVCSIVEILVGDLWLSYFAASITLFLVYLNMQVDMHRHMKEQEAALTQTRIAAMVSQIQPHFIFNALSAIVRLCDNSDASKALTTFAEYLRGNMDALSRKEPVPFQWELKHIKKYLWLEQLRFGNKLKVVYEIQTDAFDLPVLSVQPLVENAVRHGVTKRIEGGTVTIRTEENESSYRIIVADDGVGFDVRLLSEQDQSHVGIENAKRRIEMLSAGTVQIHSMPGCGTTAVIDIQKSKEKKA